LMATTTSFYLGGLAAGRSRQDTESVFEVLKSMCKE
jgi:hypothetical protein